MEILTLSTSTFYILIFRNKSINIFRFSRGLKFFNKKKLQNLMVEIFPGTRKPHRLLLTSQRRSCSQFLHHFCKLELHEDSKELFSEYAVMVPKPQDVL